MALVALLTGVYHLSRRKAAELLSDMAGVRISVGAVSAVEARVSAAVQPAVEAAWERVQQAEVKHTDGTSWFQSGLSRALWTIATAAATVFKIVADGSKQTLEPLYGALQGILVSDRAKALNFWAMEHRQICWAHLVRKFVSFAERDGPAGSLGRELLDYTGLLFEYWHDYKDTRTASSPGNASSPGWYPCGSKCRLRFSAPSMPSSVMSRVHVPTSWTMPRLSGPLSIVMASSRPTIMPSVS
jgi:transposase